MFQNSSDPFAQGLFWKNIPNKEGVKGEDTFLQMKPFDALPYDHSLLGTLVPATGGGYWILRAWTTPAGTEFRYHGLGADGQFAARDGWPPDVRGRYCFADPEDGGMPCICRCSDGTCDEAVKDTPK